jgi:hypothetical protein
MVDFKKMRAAAQKELENLVQQRTAVDRKIIGFEQAIKGLDAVCGTASEDALETRGLDPIPLSPELDGLCSVGLTDAIRKLFEGSGILLLTPTGIRDQLLMYGYDLPKDNPLAAIHAVLKRLVTNGEIEEKPAHDGKSGYKWMNVMERTLRTFYGVGASQQSRQTTSGRGTVEPNERAAQIARPQTIVRRRRRDQKP